MGKPLVQLGSYGPMQDKELLATLRALIAMERHNLALVLACIAETERRQLYADEAYPSMFNYLVGSLRYSESAAFRRLRSSRAATRFPEIFSFISDGVLSLEAVAFLAPFLTPENHDELLTRAQGLNRIGLERLVVSFAPGRDTNDYVRRLPAPEPSASDEERPEPELPTGQAPKDGSAERERSSIPATPELVTPRLAPPEKTRYVAPIRVYFSFTASEEFHNGVQRAKELLWHKHPKGRLEEVFGETLECYLERHDPERKLRRKAEKETRSREGDAAASAGPAPASPEATSSTAAPSDEKTSLRDYSARRRIPHWVRDAVWARDAGRCTFVGPDGRRCAERGGLEFDHIIPWALGGTSNDPDNIRLLCRTHNQRAASRVFGTYPHHFRNGSAVDKPPRSDGAM
ncbi:MAG: HNH endonuclease signature motif containing protein [Elusimicrobiota bacterium]